MNQLVLLSLLLATPLEEPAQQSKSPYQLTVCLRVADDPLLTERFVDGIAREVRDQLKRPVKLNTGKPIEAIYG